VVAPELASLAPVPTDVQYLWDWYTELSEARGAGFNVNAIAWSDMHAFFTLSRICPEPWEVRTIRDIDAAYLASRADESTGSVKSAGALQQRVNKRPNG
jgi:hypothetical protein